MSAIAGALGMETSMQAQMQMMTAMRRRGPSASGSYRYGDCVLLHSGTGDEEAPQILDWGQKRFVITLDGVVYNRRQLKKELENLGHPINSVTDGELILHGYAQWGEEIADKINGAFAFAILEEPSGKVFLARDKFGVKPLFYTARSGGILFGSELKILLQYPGVTAALDATGAAEILLLGPGRRPGSGVFRNMKEIEPGCSAVYERGNLRLRRYWRLTDREHRDSLEETAEKVAYFLEDSIKVQIPNGDSVGSMLSGGLDSSLVSAVAARELERNGGKLHTFSVDYLDSELHFRPGYFQPNRDTEYIRIMQGHLDSCHHWTILTPEDLVQEIADATVARDLPGMADVDTSLLAFCKQIRPHVPVVLSGECADEIFGGYPWYRDPVLRDTDGFPWMQTLKERSGFLESWITDRINAGDFVRDCYYQTLNECDILPDNSAIDRRIKQQVNLNFRWFMQTLLDRSDRMSAWQDLEIRVPFCDARLAEYLYGIPWQMKEHKGMEKGLLRLSMERWLPRSVLTRKKSPYPKTYDPKYLEIVSALLRQLLEREDAPIYHLVKRETLEELLHTDYSWPWYGQLMRRPQTIVYMLQINYWLEHYSVRIE